MTGSKIFGPKNVQILGEELDFSSHSLGGGLSIGSAVTTGSSFSVIPTGTVTLVHSQSKAEDSAGDETTSSDTYVQFTAGAGLVVSERLVIQPFVGVSVAGESNDLSFGLKLSISFGSRR